MREKRNGEEGRVCERERERRNEKRAALARRAVQAAISHRCMQEHTLYTAERLEDVPFECTNSVGFAREDRANRSAG